jgi:hypothetical protein
VITIGITGHRFIQEIDLLRSGVLSALYRIDTIYKDQTWQMVSSLAEGADRLAVECIWQYRPETRLMVPLPLPLDDYEQDFEGPQSREEFGRLIRRAAVVFDPIPALTRNDAYQTAGVRMLDHSDLLLALWDGAPTYEKGGTGDIVAIARGRKIPLVWVHCGSRSSLGINQGEVSFERIRGG